MMAAIRSEVAMGRTMKIRETFMAGLSWFRSSLIPTYVDLCSLLQLIDAFGERDLPGIEALVDRSCALLDRSLSDIAHLDGVVRFNNKNKRGLRAVLDGRGWDENRIPLRVDQQPCIHELTREQRIVLIWKRCLESHRAGIRIDLIVDRQQHACSDLRFEVAIPRIDNHALSSLQFVHNLRDIVFGNIENHGYRPQLRNDEKTVLVGGMNDVSGVHQAQSDSAVDRSSNVRIGEIQFCALNCAFIRLDHCLVLVNG